MGKKQMNKKEIKNNKKKKRKKKTWKKVLLIFLLALLIAGGVFAYKVYKNGGGMSGMLATMVGHDENTKKNLGEFRALILGISTDQDDVDLTDTIMVASYNPNTQKATLLSIPRDTYTGKNAAKATAYEKINALYSRKHRPDETLEAVNEITGLNIEYYVVVKTEALIKLVDVVGGITFNVPINMDYDDTSQDLHIHLKAGEQKLDGDKAEQLVRFRHNNNGTSYPEEYGDNDTGRMRTQREFMIQVVKQTAKPENIFKLGEILDVAKECVITNIDFNVAKDYIPYVVEFNTENMLTETLPGTNTDKNTSGTWIFIHDKAQTKTLIQELFFDRDIQETESNGQTTEGNTTVTDETISSNSKADITIEVLNGSGTSSNLQKVVNQLQGAGFKVTRTGSTNTTAKTTIINKKNVKDTMLKNMKDVIGTGTIETSESSSSKVDVTIIIGKDY
ncbi:MAG: LCP family protein [Clostridia bacterium]|nr:LCP family protein [Clostridia bacterium]